MEMVQCGKRRSVKGMKRGRFGVRKGERVRIKGRRGKGKGEGWEKGRRDQIGKKMEGIRVIKRGYGLRVGEGEGLGLEGRDNGREQGKG